MRNLYGLYNNRALIDRVGGRHSLISVLYRDGQSFQHNPDVVSLMGYFIDTKGILFYLYLLGTAVPDIEFNVLTRSLKFVEKGVSATNFIVTVSAPVSNSANAPCSLSLNTGLLLVA